MACEALRPHLDAFVDDELEASPRVELERHLIVCEACRREATLTRALKQGLRVQLEAAPAPDALRERVRGALADADGVGRWSDRVWAGALLTAAAGMLVVFGAGLWQPSPVAREAPTSFGPVAPVAFGAPTASAPTALLSDVVAQHIDPLPTESGTERAEDLTGWLRGKLNFRVAPVEFVTPGVRFLGARVSQVGRERAAKLYYQVGDNRLTIIAFEASPAVRHALRRELGSGTHTEIGGRDVAFRLVRGYTIPVFEQAGVVYALTGDLDQRQLLELLSSARLP